MTICIKFILFLKESKKLYCISIFSGCLYYMLFISNYALDGRITYGDFVVIMRKGNPDLVTNRRSKFSFSTPICIIVSLCCSCEMAHGASAQLRDFQVHGFSFTTALEQLSFREQLTSCKIVSVFESREMDFKGYIWFYFVVLISNAGYSLICLNK